ncbi:MAG: hypothetical protein H0V17_20835, partial [Deltaproteobacteria bacterium]|nr:hypothetical protein [Deltaproteobacteria bacterium]
MTGTRARAAVPLILTYWLVLLFGLVLFSVVRTDAPGMIGVLWGGAIFGTLVGHTMGLADVRLWFIAVCVGALALLGLLGPATGDAKLFWMTFAPATIAAALSVADRWSLAAFWFPAMIWMLTILDGTHGKTRPDGTAGVLLGALALSFVLFLRVRESRRVALWRTISVAPLATAASTTVFKERPGKELGRAGWMLATSAITFTFTAWLAPQLWEVETFDADPHAVVSANGPAGSGPPCCEDLLEAERTRVKEYFDFGRGRDALTGNSDQACVQCGGGEEEGGGGGGGGSYAGMLFCTDAEIDAGICIPCTEEEVRDGLCEFGQWHFRGAAGWGRGGGGGGGGGGNGGAGAGAGGAGVGGTGTGGDGTGGA